MEFTQKCFNSQVEYVLQLFEKHSNNNDFLYPIPLFHRIMEQHLMTE